MIQKLLIRNFRNFSVGEISFSGEKNILIGKNGKGKSNILEALALPANPLLEGNPEHLLEKGKDTFFLQYHGENGTCSFSYSGLDKKRKYIIGNKTSSKQKLRDIYPHIISFHPIMMNMMYLGPSERRNFLDEILSQSFGEYKKIFVSYKKILSSRNRILKNIFEGKSQRSELDFWDTQFIESATKLYSYRKKIYDFFSEHIGELKQYFFGKVDSIEFIYNSKINIFDAQNSLGNYLKKNREKEILLRRTLRGPHLDDFTIQVDNRELIHFASRGEVKSIILGLKFLETHFLQQHSKKTDILFLIDDFLSELDIDHQELLLKHIKGHQSIISSIEDVPFEGNKIFI